MLGTIDERQLLLGSSRETNGSRARSHATAGHVGCTQPGAPACTLKHLWLPGSPQDYMDGDLLDEETVE